MVVSEVEPIDAGLPMVGLVLYNFQAELAPNEPPLIVKVSVVPAPEHTVLLETATEDAAVEGVPTDHL